MLRPLAGHAATNQAELLAKLRLLPKQIPSEARSFTNSKFPRQGMRYRLYKYIPVWAIHGNADGIVPPAGTRNMVKALLKAGSKPIYWEYDRASHASTAERAYCEPLLVDWLFDQVKR